MSQHGLESGSEQHSENQTHPPPSHLWRGDLGEAANLLKMLVDGLVKWNQMTNLRGLL